MNLDIVLKQVILLVKETGHFIADEAKKISTSDIEVKGFNDFVTHVDIEAEQRLIKELKKMTPDTGFIVEEDRSQKKSKEYNWIIDPIDGTTNFIHAIPVYAISIALSYKDEIVLGIVYEINSDECFHAIKGGRAFLNDQVISVSMHNKLSDGLIATGFPYNDFSKIEPYLALFKDLMQSSRGIRRLGSAAVDLAYVACGRFDVFYEYSLKPWDVAAGAFIVQQAGGKVSDFLGKSDYIYGQHIIATNNLLHDDFIRKVQTYFI
ncbi:MAG: inositol monophosphatase family protein [Bacteroidales bacterium]|jgi:myo-inositol-1(or 4)-monophosphatase|nr:inositol monophosphatase family protein [Bacteroidales bacterium]